MSWLRNDDNMLDHEKWRRAIRKGGDGVLATWFRLTSWCSRRLTDGIVPPDMVDEVAELVGSKARTKTLQALVEARLLAWADPDEDTLDLRRGLVEPTPGARRELAGLVIVGYLERNPSRVEVMAERGRLAQVKRNQRHGKDVPTSRPVPSRPLEATKKLLQSASDATAASQTLSEPEPEPEPPEHAPVPEQHPPSAPVLELVRSPIDAQGRRTVWHNLDGWEITEDVYAEAEIRGLPRERLEFRVAKLRNGPIGGARGVFDRAQHVLEMVPTWRTWDESDATRKPVAEPGPKPKFRTAAEAMRDGLVKRAGV